MVVDALGMPERHMCTLHAPVGAGLEESVIEVEIEMVRLHEPHEMHGVDGPREPAVSLVDVVTDGLGACDSLRAILRDVLVRGGVRHQIGRPYLSPKKHRAGMLRRYPTDDCVDRRVHRGEVRRTIALEDAVEPDGVRK